MCLAFPGKIIQIENSIATVDYGSETREAKIITTAEDGSPYQVGDYVIVQAKLVAEKVPEQQLQGWLELLQKAQSDIAL